MAFFALKLDKNKERKTELFIAIECSGAFVIEVCNISSSCGVLLPKRDVSTRWNPQGLLRVC